MKEIIEFLCNVILLAAALMFTWLLLSCMIESSIRQLKGIESKKEDINAILILALTCSVLWSIYVN